MTTASRRLAHEAPAAPGRPGASGSRLAARSRPVESGRPHLLSGDVAFDRDDIWERMVKPGDRLPTVTLLEADLGPVHLDRLLMTGPIVLVFFQHATSERGTAALADYERRLVPGPVGHDDPRHRLIDAFNLGFHAPGADVLLGARRSILPFPAVVVADRAGTVRYADVRPDGAAHPAPSEILAALSPLS